MYVCMYVWTYVCMYVCMYAHAYIHTYIRTYMPAYSIHTYPLSIFVEVYIDCLLCYRDELWRDKGEENVRYHNGGKKSDKSKNEVDGSIMLWIWYKHLSLLHFFYNLEYIRYKESYNWYFLMLGATNWGFVCSLIISQRIALRCNQLWNFFYHHISIISDAKSWQTRLVVTCMLELY